MTSPRTEVLEALRQYAVRYQESAHELARWMGLPTVDGTALGEIVWAEREQAPLSPSRLAARVGLTTGATNALLTRLESRGLVERSRESSDRRLVTVRSTDAAQERLEPFLARSAAELAGVLDDYDDAALELIRGFLGRMSKVLPSG
ncbi:MarR family transcriptional regulator [Rathayibacter sp. VKM Ac-2760]|uniref:MarR family winged helix-turn-helix transcriptional regulator n=1 Tax=Rathayibacter sp. VKM Ac-2760 TaxID=2609253 RepID=UPI0013198FA2|nr:MarR family transcriptional regulator [Rathayibacter sp. VKM Ac-2760]QHC58870.1 MarR family transcriptional regulator [Rathayibacter sp. VKM Ac-2760]